VRRLVSSYWPDRVERMTGVPARQNERAAHILREAATVMLLTGRGTVPQLLVPDAAVGTDQSGKLVMVVRDDGVVVPKPTGPLEDHAMRVVTHGLLPTDRVVVQGLMRVRPGMKVEQHLQMADATPKG
jgi:multidrug efflux pump subunit AcrA (membrane-fusion protein)